MEKPDKETSNILAEGESVKRLVESDGWKLVRAKLIYRTNSLLSMVDIVEPNPTTIIQVIAARQEAARELLRWLQEVEGTAEQHRNNGDILKQIKDEYIVNY